MVLRVLIDPGHCLGEVNGGPTGYLEVEGMWILSNYLKEELEKRNIKADLTKKVRTDCPSLAQRGSMAKGYDLFLSNHSNGFDGTVRGSTVFYSIKRPKDKAHAASLAAATAKLMGNNNRGAKTRLYPNRTDLDYYGVIRAAVATGCPHVFMAESGFHDNPIDEAWLKKDSNMRKLAEVQAIEICKMLGVSSEVKPDPDKGDDVTDTLYRVQVGAFRVRSNAEDYADQIRKAGFDAYVTTAKAVAPDKPVPKPVIKKGDLVKVKRGTKTYTGGNLSSWVYGETFTVLETPRGDRVVIGQRGQVTAALHARDLIKQ